MTIYCNGNDELYWHLFLNEQFLLISPDISSCISFKVCRFTLLYLLRAHCFDSVFFSSDPPRIVKLETSKNEEHSEISDFALQDGVSEGPLMPILEENIPDDDEENMLDNETSTLPEEHDTKNYILVLSKFISSIFSSINHLTFFSFI